MTFRPRYSLLALLLFTAAVAGGVKLWRGPHHVVDCSNPQMEDEYTYYRDWDGKKIVDGVRVRRYGAANASTTLSKNLDDKTKKVLAHPASGIFILDYYRNGKLVHSGGKFVSYPIEYGPYDHIKDAPMFTTLNDQALETHELLAYDAAVQEEKVRYQKLGGVVWQFTGSTYK